MHSTKRVCLKRNSTGVVNVSEELTPPMLPVPLNVSVLPANAPAKSAVPFSVAFERGA